MKKILALMMLVTMTISLAACKTNKADDNDDKNGISETVTIQALDANGEKINKEVPYNPERIAVLDMPALDILDALGVGDRIVGSAKVSIEYLTEYNPDDSNGAIMNLGTVKTADLEKAAACAPDIIFIGGRLASMYADLEAIAPVVYLGVDYEQGIVESTKANVRTIAGIFGKEAEVDTMFADLQPRIDALHTILNGKNVLLGMFNANALSLMDTNSQLNIIAKELGANNLGETVGEAEKASHGEEASWETILTLNPEYLFVLDRSTATEATDGSVMGVREVLENDLIKELENDLIKELDVYKEGKIVCFIEHANVWYTSTGGVQALDTMLADLEDALLNEK